MNNILTFNNLLQKKVSKEKVKWKGMERTYYLVSFTYQKNMIILFSY